MELEFIANNELFLPYRNNNSDAGSDVRIDLTNVKSNNEYDIEKCMIEYYGDVFISGKLGRAFDTNAEYLIVEPGETKCIPLGFKVNLDSAHFDDNLIPYLEIVSRSGLASKGLIVANAPGVIDIGYLDEVKVLLHNQNSVPHILKHGDRVAQVMLKFSEVFKIKLVNTFDAEDRGGGLGSTGL